MKTCLDESEVSYADDKCFAVDAFFPELNVARKRISFPSKTGWI